MTASMCPKGGGVTTTTDYHPYLQYMHLQFKTNPPSLINGAQTTTGDPNNVFHDTPLNSQYGGFADDEYAWNKTILST